MIAFIILGIVILVCLAFAVIIISRPKKRQEKEEKQEKKDRPSISFTTWNTRDGFNIVFASDVTEADRNNDYTSELIIQGTIDDIEAMPGRYIQGRLIREEVQKGAVCTIEAGVHCKVDKITIQGAVYQGTVVVDGHAFYAFTKNGVAFWVWLPYFISIDGRNIF